MQIQGSIDEKTTLLINPQEHELRVLTEQLNGLLVQSRSFSWINNATLLRNRIDDFTANKTKYVSQECFEMAERLKEGSQSLDREIQRLNSEVNREGCIKVVLCFLFIASLALPYAVIHFSGEG